LQFTKKPEEGGPVQYTRGGGAVLSRHKSSYTPLLELTYMSSMNETLVELQKGLFLNTAEKKGEKTFTLQEKIKEIQNKKGGRQKKAHILSLIKELMEKPFSEKCKMLSQFLHNTTMFTDALLEGRQKAILTRANEILTPEDIPPPSPITLTSPIHYKSASGVTGLLPQARGEPSGEPLIEGAHKGGASDSNKQKQEATKIKAQLALPWSQYKLDKMEVLLEKITTVQLDPTRSAILQNIRYSSNLLSKKWDEVAATILRELRTETTSTHGEPYENRLLRAVVETWVAQDYNKILENDAKELNIDLADIGPLSLYQPPSPSSMGQKARTLGHGALSLGRRATHKISKMASWASRLAHKHLQNSEDCPVCESGGNSEAYIKQAIAKCQKEKTCVSRAKDIKTVDVMISPSSFKPFYSVAIYENPAGKPAEQVVAETAAAAQNEESTTRNETGAVSTIATGEKKTTILAGELLTTEEKQQLANLQAKHPQLGY